MRTIAARHPEKTPRRIRERASGAGVVGFYMRGASDGTGLQNFTPSKLVELVGGGLPLRELNDLQDGLDVPAERLAPMLGISKATFHRRQAGKRLGVAESDRVVRFARLLGQAVRAFGNLDDARRWLGSPQFGLGNAVPLDFAKTELGAREVENLLGRIEYGVYS